jgi:DNA-binding transcriptional MocR family regulator
MRSSAIRELLKLTEQPDIISFCGGLPAPEVFRSKIPPACERVLIDHGAQALQYSTTEGTGPYEIRLRAIRRATTFKLNRKTSCSLQGRNRL